MDNLIDEELVDNVTIMAEEETIGEGENAKKQICFRGIFSEADSLNGNKRVYPKAVLREVFEEAKNKAARTGQPIFGELEHACFAYNTFKVLTKTGYKPFTELNVGEEVLTFGENNVIEYKPILKIINSPYSGKVYHIKGRNIDTTVSGNHKFFLLDRDGKKQIATAKELFDDRTKYSHSKIVKCNAVWNGNDKDVVVIPGVPQNQEDLVLQAKPFFGFMGLFLSEGCGNVVNDGNIVNIAQKKPENIQKIRDLLTELGLPFKEAKKADVDGVDIYIFSINDRRLKEYVRPLGHSWEKYIPLELKEYNVEYLNEMLEWFILGDGRDRRNEGYSKYVNIFSTSRRMMEDFNEILVKCGVSGNITEKTQKDHLIWEGTEKERIIKAENCRPLYQLNISTVGGICLDKRFLKIEEEDFEGNIYCLEVKDNHNFYVEDKNKFFLTGNSDAHINLERIAVTFPEFNWDEEKGQIIGKAVPTLTEAGKVVEGLAKSGFKVCFSTRMSGKVKPMTEERKRQYNITEDCVEVCPGAKLISIDIVGNPSCAKAVTTTVYEEKTLTERQHNPTFKVVFDNLI